MISIIIATFNRAHTLQRSLESVFAQEELLEVIVVDDGSTDETQSVLKKYTDPRLRCILLDSNKGASFARNHGIAKARGEYVMVWDSDDELFPSACATLLGVFQKHPEAIVASAPGQMFRNSEAIPFSERKSGFVSFDEILCKYLPSNEKVRLTRTSIAQKTPYVSKNLDFLVSVSLAKQGPWFHVREPLATVHVDGPDSLTRARKKFNARLSVERGKYIERFLHLFGDRMRRLCPDRYAAFCYGACVGCFVGKKQKEARKFAFRAVVSQPLNLRYVGVLVLCCVPFSAHVVAGRLL